MPPVKNGLNEAERCVPKIMTVIMEVKREPSWEIHFMPMTLELENLPNILLRVAENASSEEEESNLNLLHSSSLSSAGMVP